MKLLIAALILLPTLAFAEVTTVRLGLIGHVDLSNSKVCTYTSEVYLGNSNTLTPFNFMTLQEDGTYAILVRTNTLQLAKNGQFFTKVSKQLTLGLKENCPGSTELLLVK